MQTITELFLLHVEHYLDSSIVASVCDLMSEEASNETCFCLRSSKETSGVLAPPLACNFFSGYTFTHYTLTRIYVTCRLCMSRSGVFGCVRPASDSIAAASKIIDCWGGADIGPEEYAET